MKARNFERDNTVAAHVIMSDPTKYGGIAQACAEQWLACHGGAPKKPVSASTLATGNPYDEVAKRAR